MRASRALVEREAGAAAPRTTRASCGGAWRERSFGLGPLEPLLADPRGRRGDGQRARARCGSSARGRLERDRRRVRERGASCATRSSGSSRRWAGASTRREPLCDARLPDGSRVNVVIPPLALDGPVLTIRRFRRRGLLARRAGRERDAAAPRCATSWRACVRARATVLVSGGTGSGKTTTLDALSALHPATTSGS